MLSAVLVVIVGVAFAVVHSYRKNLRDVAAGRRGYRPAPGLIGWDEAAPAAGPGGTGGTGGTVATGSTEAGRAGGEPGA